jgi:hypothetical protein
MKSLINAMGDELLNLISKLHGLRMVKVLEEGISQFRMIDVARERWTSIVASERFKAGIAKGESRLRSFVQCSLTSLMRLIMLSIEPIPEVDELKTEDGWTRMVVGDSFIDSQNIYPKVFGVNGLTPDMKLLLVAVLVGRWLVGSWWGSSKAFRPGYIFILST